MRRITWFKIYVALGVGFILFFLNTLLLKLSPIIGTFLYMLTISLGYITLLMAGVWMSRLLRTNLMDDVFNNENESFQQGTKLMGNEYSVNLPVFSFCGTSDIYRSRAFGKEREILKLIF